MEKSILQIHQLKTQIGSQVIHEGLDLSLAAGEILGLVGGSGSGKSVLLRTILGLMPHQEGSISLFGEELQGASLASVLKRRCGVLFQNGALFSALTVGENIMMPLIETSRVKAKLAQEIALLKLSLVGLDASAFYKYPNELSGGMVKRASLARALALDAELLFLDEPTAGLDPISAGAFDALLRQLQQSLGLSVLMITHDLDTLHAVCDRVAVLVDRQIHCGTMAQVSLIEHPWIQDYFHGTRAARFVE